MTQLTHRQIAWRVAQDLPHAARVTLGSGMPLLVPDYVDAASGIVFAPSRKTADEFTEPCDDGRAEFCLVGAHEVAANGDLVEDVALSSSSLVRLHRSAATVPHVIVMAEYFGANGSSILVPQCSTAPQALRCVTAVYTDIAVLLLHDGKVWLREIIEGITLPVLQAETEVQLHVSPDLRLLQAPALR